MNNSTPDLSIYATDFPLTKPDDAPWSERVVTEGHAAYCHENGHAFWNVNGIDQGRCPRCGEVTESPALTPRRGNPDEWICEDEAALKMHRRHLIALGGEVTLIGFDTSRGVYAYNAYTPEPDMFPSGLDDPSPEVSPLDAIPTDLDATETTDLDRAEHEAQTTERDAEREAEVDNPNIKRERGARFVTEGEVDEGDPAIPADMERHAITADALDRLERDAERETARRIALVSTHSDLRAYPLETAFILEDDGSIWRLRGWYTDWNSDDLAQTVASFSVQLSDGSMTSRNFHPADDVRPVLRAVWVPDNLVVGTREETATRSHTDRQGRRLGDILILAPGDHGFRPGSEFRVEEIVPARTSGEHNSIYGGRFLDDETAWQEIHSERFEVN